MTSFELFLADLGASFLADFGASFFADFGASFFPRSFSLFYDFKAPLPPFPFLSSSSESIKFFADFFFALGGTSEPFLFFAPAPPFQSYSESESYHLSFFFPPFFDFDLSSSESFIFDFFPFDLLFFPLLSSSESYFAFFSSTSCMPLACNSHYLILS